MHLNSDLAKVRVHERESDALKWEEAKRGDQPDMDRWMVNGV